MSSPSTNSAQPPAAAYGQSVQQTSKTNYAAPAESPPPSVPTPAAPLAVPAVTPHANPKVAELQAMFPTVEVSVIELVLETCGGSTDRSIEQLLSMTDDNFKPDELESVRREEAVCYL
jgi:glyceraldehyde-3-phosphate dehydrogenase/erythrose-4-phosphate dehydrogenase